MFPQRTQFVRLTGGAGRADTICIPTAISAMNNDELLQFLEARAFVAALDCPMTAADQHAAMVLDRFASEHEDGYYDASILLRRELASRGLSVALITRGMAFAVATRIRQRGTDPVPGHILAARDRALEWPNLGSLTGK